MPTRTIAEVSQECRDSWPGGTGEQRAKAFEAHIKRVLPEYAAAFGMTEAQVWEALERRRNYGAINYYQEANQPRLDGVRVFATTEAMMAALRPELGFRCPACGGVSKDSQTCDSGVVRDSKECNWKSWGFLRTLGKGLRVVVAEQFLDSGCVHEIFMPIALESHGQP